MKVVKDVLKDEETKRVKKVATLTKSLKNLNKVKNIWIRKLRKLKGKWGPLIQDLGYKKKLRWRILLFFMTSWLWPRRLLTRLCKRSWIVILSLGVPLNVVDTDIKNSMINWELEFPPTSSWFTSCLVFILLAVGLGSHFY